MNITVDNDIITALATPYGRSAIAVIRISGNGCIEKVGKFLTKPLKNGEMKLNRFVSDEITENLMAVSFRAPSTYTGEDTVELFPHGNMMICDAIIKTLMNSGIRAAEKGEFTKRAFMNGKLDLMQCEALADIIDAQTPEQLAYGNKRYNGGFDKLDEAEKLLNTALSTIEAVLHYSDELEGGEQDEALMSDVYESVDRIIELLESEKQGYAGGKILNDGFKVVLFGKPNVGKSTLINVLTGTDRAIVTSIAGTTRDTVDGCYSYNGRKFSITDTAGFRPTGEVTDPVEKIGIERAIKSADEADLVIIVTDGSGEIPFVPFGNKNKLIVKNKCDKNRDVGKDYAAAEKDGVFEISAKRGINITALKEKLYSLCPKDFGGICNHRQYACVDKCLFYLKPVKTILKEEESLEIVAAMLYDAYSEIEELYGERADEKVIDTVFKRFCVGK